MGASWADLDHVSPEKSVMMRTLYTDGFFVNGETIDSGQYQIMMPIVLKN